eukprot:2630318-Rhodomonas_salina.1
MQEPAVFSPEAQWELDLANQAGPAPSPEGTVTQTRTGVKRDTITSQDGNALSDSAQSKKTLVEEQSSTERTARQSPREDAKRPQRCARVAGPELEGEKMEESAEGAPV